MKRLRRGVERRAGLSSQVVPQAALASSAELEPRMASAVPRASHLASQGPPGEQRQAHAWLAPPRRELPDAGARLLALQRQAELLLELPGELKCRREELQELGWVSDPALPLEQPPDEAWPWLPLLSRPCPPLQQLPSRPVPESASAPAPRGAGRANWSASSFP